MKEYIVRIQGEMMDIEPLEGETCSDVEELEAIMVAMIKTLNERLTHAEKKIKELEARPQIEPVVYDELPGNLPFFDHLYRPELITYTVTCKH